MGLPQISPTLERVEVYRQVLREHHIMEADSNIRYVRSKKRAFEVAKELINKGCTALVATNTAMTHDVLNYIESVDMKIGKDIVIGGFVDSEFANRFMNRIPVVYEPVKEMGYEAGGMILKKTRRKSGISCKSVKVHIPI